MAITPNSNEESAALRQLALVDRIIGLEAEIVHMRSAIYTDAVRTQVDSIKASPTWKVGRVVLSPLTLMKKLVKRGSSRSRRV
jgi:hypothetical protein